LPRQSAEARGASIYLAGNRPLAPPKTLARPAKAVWRQIVESRPPDYFRQWDIPLLTRYCALSARAAEVEAVVSATPVDAKDAPRLEKRLATLAAAVGGLAQRLRLTPAARIERHSGQRNETWSIPPREEEDRLIGGYAVWGR
jgi:phage terminase small subunit